MKTSQLALCLLVPTLLVASTSCSTTSSPARFRETRTLTVEHVSGSAIKVNTENGAISVKAADRGDVEIVADLRMTSQERLDAVEVLASRDSADRLTVEVGWPEDRKKNNEGCSFRITVPDANGVELKTANGPVDIAGLSGKADLHTSNGPIEVKNHNGNLLCRTSNGTIKVASSSGEIDTSTSNGRIDIRDATEAVRARTSNGSVHVSFAEEAPGPLNAHSSNGAITLELGRAFEGELEVRNSNGSLDVGNLPDASILSAGKHHMLLKFGDSDNQSRAVTSNGSIHVHGR